MGATELWLLCHSKVMFMSHSNVELQFEMVSRDSGSERALRECEMRIMQLRLQVTDRKEKKQIKR